MKKLAFNEITKEIDIIEQKEINEIESSENENLKKNQKESDIVWKEIRFFLKYFLYSLLGS